MLHINLLNRHQRIIILSLFLNQIKLQVSIKVLLIVRVCKIHYFKTFSVILKETFIFILEICGEIDINIEECTT